MSVTFIICVLLMAVCHFLMTGTYKIFVGNLAIVWGAFCREEIAEKLTTYKLEINAPVYYIMSTWLIEHMLDCSCVAVM